MKPCIVAFVGTVGSGKSTQIKLLRSKLRAEGLKVQTTVIKAGHLLAYSLEVILDRALNNRKNTYPIKALVDRPDFFKKIFKFWLILDMVSISTRFMLTVYLPKRMQNIVLVEEYLPAAIADYFYLADFIGIQRKNLVYFVNFLQRLLFRGGPLHIVYLDASDVILENRWGRRMSLEERPDYLAMQRGLLLFLSMNLSTSHIRINTGNKTIEQTHNLILSYLRNL